jgi:hypothetical protein
MVRPRHGDDAAVAGQLATVLRASTGVICAIPYRLATRQFLFTSAPPANSTIRENGKV